MTGESQSFSGRIERARLKDGSSADRLVADYHRWLRDEARRTFGERVAGEIGPSDVAHDTLLVARESLAKFSGENEATFRGWLRTILRRIGLVAQRRQYRGPGLVQTLPAGSTGPEVPIAQLSTAASKIDRHDAYRRLMTAIEWLAPADRELVITKCLEEPEVTFKELGLRLKETPENLRQRLCRLRAALGEAVAIQAYAESHHVPEHSTKLFLQMRLRRCSFAELAQIWECNESAIKLLYRKAEQALKSFWPERKDESATPF